MTQILSRLLPAIAALCVTTSLHAAPVPPAEKLLPDDTLVMFTVPESAKLQEISKTSPAAQLWNDAAMKPFRDKFMTKLREELIVPLERELGVKLDTYAALAQGQATLALTANGWQGEKDKTAKPGLLFLLDARDKQGDLEKALKDFRAKWTDKGKPLRIEKVRDVEFMIVTMTTNDIPDTLSRLLPGRSKVRELGDEESENEDKTADASAGKSEIIIGRVDSVFIAGNSLKAIERVVSQLTGGSEPVVADVAQFQSCQPVFFREAHAYGWVNAKKLVEAMTKVSARREEASEDAPDPFATMKPEKILDAAGLGGLRNAAFAYQDSADGPVLHFHLGVPESERKGLLKIFAGEPRETTPPPFVPADAVKFMRWRVDGQKSWSTLTSSMNEIAPQIMGMVDYFLSTANELGKLKDENFDLRRQLIGNLGDDVISFGKKPRSAELADLMNPPEIMMIGSKKAEEMVSALKLTFGAFTGRGKPPEEREFLGRKIYTVTTTAAPQLDPTNIKAQKLHLSHSGGYVLIANDEAALEEYLRNGEAQPKPLSETVGLQDAMARVTGPGTSLFGFENQVEAQRAAFDLIRKTLGADGKVSPGGMTPVSESFGIEMPTESLKAWFDYSLLPPFDAVAKYHHFVVYGGSANVDGLTLKMFVPVPPGLKK